jgi:phosphatidylserine decarboxylase
MGITPHGIREIVVSGFCLGAAAVALFTLSPWLVAAPVASFLGVLCFFRDPARQIPTGEALVVSPADGTVVDIEAVEEPPFLGTACVRVGIFLSIANVHVNRAPIAGVVKETRYTPGRFHHANSRRASAENEANDVWLRNDALDVDVVFRQISGQAARRIVCTCKPKDLLAKGQKVGMIKFGSRTEVYIPQGKLGSLKVNVRDRVKGGESVLAILNGRSSDEI